MSADFAMSIASLYLGLVGLLSTFFAIHLGQWLMQIQATESKWNQVRDREPKIDFFNQRLECYFESSSAATPWTFVGWLVVTSFLIVLFVFELVLSHHVSAEGASTLKTFVFWPACIFFLIFLSLSVVMLCVGYRKARLIRNGAREIL